MDQEKYYPFNQTDNPFEPLWQKAYHCLFHDIITTKLAPGSLIKESKLAQELSISRSPLRVALDRLCDDGLLEKCETPGYQVTKITADDCLHLCEARLAIECRAAALAAKLISDEQLSELRNLLIKMKKIHTVKPGDWYVSIDDQFHHIIVEAACNPYISGMYQEIEGKILRYRYWGLMFDKVTMLNVYPYHVAIYQALRNHLSDAASSEIARDIDSMRVVSVYLNNIE